MLYDSITLSESIFTGADIDEQMRFKRRTRHTFNLRLLVSLSFHTGAQAWPVHHMFGWAPICAAQSNSTLESLRLHANK